MAYSYIYEIIGEEIHNWVGEEPSGVVFNAPVFDGKGRPHNPMVNAGAIMTCAILILNNKNIDDVMEFYKKSTGAAVVEVDQELYREEKATGYTNHALTSLMLANSAFP